MSTPDQMVDPAQFMAGGTPPQMTVPPPVPVNGPVDDDSDEREARDVLAVELAQAAAKMAQASLVSQKDNDGKNAESFAHAALYMTQAHILIAPLEAADDLTQNAAKPGVPSASSSTSSGA